MKERKCKECLKKLSISNYGKYCFACNARCIIRDDDIIDEAKTLILSTKAKIKFLKNKRCVEREIKRLEKLVISQLKLIENVKK